MYKNIFAQLSFFCNKVYEGDVDMRFMSFVALQPLVEDEAFMSHMKATDVPFHLLYVDLTCYQRLQSGRPKC